MIKQYKLNWQTTHTDKLGILDDQLSKIIQRKEKDKAAKIMKLQLSNQVRYTQNFLRQRERIVYFYCKKPGQHKKTKMEFRKKKTKASIGLL